MNERPAELDISVRCWLIAAGLYVVAAVINFALQNDIQAATFNYLKAQRLDTSSASMADAGGGIGSLLGGIVIAALWVGLVFLMRGGVNWARIVLTLVGVMGIVLTVIGLIAASILIAVGFGGILVLVLDILLIIFAIVGIVYMYRGAANQFFEA